MIRQKIRVFGRLDGKSTLTVSLGLMFYVSSLLLLFLAGFILSCLSSAGRSRQNNGAYGLST